MAKDKSLREHVVDLLVSDGAHVSLEMAMKEMPLALQGKRPPGVPHSAWELLEHMRIAQWDILEFTRDAAHVSPEWPKGYWPVKPEASDADDWNKSVAAFQTDLKAFVALVADDSSDLLASLPHSEGKSILREALLLADHNVYHLGQLVLVRRMLGAWED